VTCRIWRLSLFYCTRYTNRGHVTVSVWFVLRWKHPAVEITTYFSDPISFNIAGLSFKTQALYALVFLTRYVDLFYRWVSLYNSVMKVFFITSSCYILYLMKYKYKSVESHFLICNDFLTFSQIRPTHDPSIDTFKIEYILAPSLILGLIFNYRYNFTEILWSFSIWLEAISILPQLFMLQRTGEAETITTHYLAALGVYRALYIPNWIYRQVPFGYTRQGNRPGIYLMTSFVSIEYIAEMLTFSS